MKLLSTNSKTGYSVNWNHNTCKSDCPFGSHGDKTCYGLKGPCSWSPAKRANAARLAMYLTDPVGYFTSLQAEIVRKRKPISYIRINGNGDTPDALWALGFVAMAKRTPDVRYWVATRYPEFWDNVAQLDNVIVRYSHGLKGEHTSTVVYDVAQATCPATTGEVSDCKACGYKCWSKDVPHVSYLKH